jgi:uncharacterized glyoxalase superfamily metalloenzyme YdcJ
MRLPFRWQRRAGMTLRLDDRRDAAPRSLAQGALAQGVGQLFKVLDAVDRHGGESGVGRAQSQDAMSGKPHAERFHEVEMLDREHLDAVHLF